MLRNDVSYPYPVVRTTTVDFEKTKFNDKITVNATPEGYEFIAEFSVNNKQISRMIEEGILKYCIFVTCKSTLLRTMYEIDLKNPIIKIEAGKLRYQVHYIAYIIASQKIENFFDDDFIKDYKGIDFELDCGAIVGIGTPRMFRALYEKDRINDVSSMIQIQGSDTEKYMKVDLENPYITVVMPQRQCAIYKNFQGQKSKYALLHAIVVVPALMEAINKMYSVVIDGEDAEGMDERPWFITLQQEITKLAALLKESEESLYYNALRTAQIILNNNSGLALKCIEELA